MPIGRAIEPGQDDGGDRDDHGQPEPVANDLGDRSLPLHGHAEVTAHHQAHPAHVLDIHRLVERVLGAQLLRLIGRDAAARGGKIGDIGIDEVAGRQLDDGEGQHRDRPAREQSEQDAADQIAEHGSLEQEDPIAPLCGCTAGGGTSGLAPCRVSPFSPRRGRRAGDEGPPRRERRLPYDPDYELLK